MKALITDIADTMKRLPEPTPSVFHTRETFAAEQHAAWLRSLYAEREW